MTNLLFNFTIGPLQLVYELLYNGLFALTHHYGWALVLLSFVTSVITVPLGKAVSAHIKKERLIENILDPQIKKIKAISSGAEQSKRIQNLYKRYAYNPLYSIRLAFGVLIQLPFLIGAYWMIAEHPSLGGISFGPIADLSQPDRLLGGINILPLIMTAANLGVVAISAQMPKRDRIQAIVIAILFLILLYSAPSALLIYWTGNNVISLLKSVYRRLVNEKNKHLFAFEFKLKCSKEQLWLFYFYLIGVACVVLTLKTFNLSPLAVSTLKAISDLIFIAIIVFLMLSNFRQWKVTHTNLDTLKIAIILLITLFVTIRVFSYWIWGVDRKLLSTQLICCIPLIVGITYWNYLNSRIKSTYVDTASFQTLFWPSVLVTLGLIFIYFPINLYLSDTEVFKQSFREVLSAQVILLEITLIILFILWISLKKLGKTVLATVTTFCALCALTFGFLISPDYGVMNAFILQNTQPIHAKVYQFVDICVCITLGISLVCILAFRKSTILRNVLIVGAITFFVFPVLKLSLQDISFSEKVESSSLTNKLPENVKSFFSYSQHGKNVLIIMLDMFTGGHMEEILNRNPYLIQELDGFVWYKDTITAGSATVLGKACILGGKNSHPLAINERKDFHSIEQKILFDWRNFLTMLKNENYEISVHEYMWLAKDENTKELKSIANLINSHHLWNRFEYTWQNGGEISNEKNVSNFFTVYGLFKILPLSLRKTIYDDGNWLKTIDRADHGQKHSGSWLEELDSLSKYAKLENTTKNTFKFISNLVTHDPWSLDAFCKPTKNIKDKSPEERHLQTAICSIKSINKLIHWLKQSGIYDNTQIILVSDHDRYDSPQLKMTWGGSYFPASPHGLLLVKDFNKQGKLFVNETSLMSNCDVPDIVKNSNLKGQANHSWLDPLRVRCNVVGAWQRQRHNEDSFVISSKYCVKGSMFTKKNWQKTKF